MLIVDLGNLSSFSAYTLKNLKRIMIESEGETFSIINCNKSEPSRAANLLISTTFQSKLVPFSRFRMNLRRRLNEEDKMSITIFFVALSLSSLLFASGCKLSALMVSWRMSKNIKDFFSLLNLRLCSSMPLFLLVSKIDSTEMLIIYWQHEGKKSIPKTQKNERN